eukprot:7559817-Pyramimonas_sp.AAC.1
MVRWPSSRLGRLTLSPTARRSPTVPAGARREGRVLGMMRRRNAAFWQAHYSKASQLVPPPSARCRITRSMRDRSSTR